MPDTTIAEAEIVEADVLPDRRHQPAAVAPTTLFGTSDPTEVIEAATATAEALTAILEERHLYAVMGIDNDGKERRHVQIEGWALLGSMTGVFAGTIWSREILDKTGKPLGWEARAEASTLAGQTVGAAEAECRWAEENWTDRDSFALRSMAQTRAQSKALAMPLRFIVELAGFQGTPAEEMTRGNGNGAKALTHHEGHPVYDNTGDPKKMEDRWPAFKCKNRDCDLGEDGKPWATWDLHYFDEDPSIQAKQRLYAAVKGSIEAWKAYYPLDDPSYGDDGSEAALVASIHEADDAAQMAGKMWADIGEACLDSSTAPSTEELTLITETAKIILDAIGHDPDQLMSYPEAWEKAEEQYIDRADDRAEEEASLAEDGYH